MGTDHEIARLQGVYQSYEARGLGQEQWSLANPGNRAMLQERRRVLERMLQDGGYFPLAGRKVLDVGCGSGYGLAEIAELGARPEDLLGVDLLPELLAEARSRYPDLRFEPGNAERLNVSDASIDLALLYTVFTSILDPSMAERVAGEVIRVLRPGGAVVWYDFRYDNPNNPHVRAVVPDTIRRLFPGFELRLRTTTLLPPLARRLGAATSLLYPVLARVPPLRTHYAGLLIKPGDSHP